MDDQLIKMIEDLRTMFSGYWKRETSSKSRIIDQMECDFMDTIEILYTDKFRVQFNKITDKIEFETTFSNQLIDATYVKELNFIQNCIETVEAHLAHGYAEETK